MELTSEKEEEIITQNQELRDEFLKIFQELRLEERDLEDFDELKRIKDKIKHYKTRLAKILPNFIVDNI